MLGPYRVLDLTDEGALICGQVLGDFGADVILVEPPGGVSARKIGPFRGDERNVYQSLNFWALNRNKRSITIDLESSAGRENLLQLVNTADILIESFSPGLHGSTRPWLSYAGRDQSAADCHFDHSVRTKRTEGAMGGD
jgi:crotonobetainyl-CoA:carnitine CoA-transferase CaiB-like acyl-CoA transferase